MVLTLPGVFILCSGQHMNIVENDHYFIRLRIVASLNSRLRVLNHRVCARVGRWCILVELKDSVQGYKVLVNSMQSTKCYEMTRSRRPALWFKTVPDEFPELR